MRLKKFDDHYQMVTQIIRRDLHDNIGLLSVVGMPANGHFGTFIGNSSSVMATKIFDDLLPVRIKYF